MIMMMMTSQPPTKIPPPRPGKPSRHQHPFSTTRSSTRTDVVFPLWTMKVDIFKMEADTSKTSTLKKPCHLKTDLMVNCSTFPTDSHPSSLSQEATSPSNFCKIDQMRFAFSPSIPFCMLCSQEHLEGQVLSKKPAKGSMADVYYNFFCFPIQRGLPEHR